MQVPHMLVDFAILCAIFFLLSLTIADVWIRYGTITTAEVIDAATMILIMLYLLHRISFAWLITPSKVHTSMLSCNLLFYANCRLRPNILN